MKKIFVTVAFILAGISLNFSAPALIPCDVIVFFGQSNAWGFPQNQAGFTWPGSDPGGMAGSQTNIYLWTCNNVFANYNAGTFQLDCTNTLNHYFSWDLPLAKAMLAARGVPQFVVKVAVGGTSICANQAGSDWHDCDGELRTTLETTIVKAKKWLYDNGYDPTFTIIGFDQGEADSAQPTEVYQKEVFKIIQQARAMTGNYKCKVIMRQVTNYSTVATAQTNWKNLSGLNYIISPAGTANYATGDGIHLTAASLYTIGNIGGTTMSPLTYP